MALHANIVDSGREVVGIGGGIVIRFMACEAIGGHIGIVARNVTLVAVIDGMTLGERKACVIKDGRFPTRHGGVALHANIVDSCREMVGIGGGIVICLMAGEAIGGHIGVVSRNVTLVAVVDGMSQGEGKVKMFVFCRFPSRHGGVALHAHIVNSGNKVIGIGGGIIVGLMAGKTLCGNIGIIARIVTFIAIIDGVPLGERKVKMFVLCRFPSGHSCVALHAHI